MYQTKNIDFAASVKDVDGKKGVISGYFAIFGNEDSDGDIIEAGAFTKTIRERGPQSTRPRVKILRNHLIYEPIAKLDVLKEDNKGLYYEGTPGTNFVGTDTVKMIESGLITEHSFGFDTVRQTVINPDADWRDRKRRLHELMLWEGSLLTAWGANERTGEAMLKSMGKEAYFQMLQTRHKSLETFCRNTTATDETIELLLMEAKQLTQIILDISTPTTAPEKKSTLPVGVLSAFTTFNNSLNKN